MYITRKVFSAREEDIIAAIEERAFCAGYEQRMFDEAEEEKLSTNAKIGLAALGSTAAMGGGMYGLSKYDGRGLKSKGKSAFKNSKLGELLGKEENILAKGGHAVQDKAEKLGKMIKDAAKTGKGKAALAGIALAPAAAIGLGVAGKKAYQNRKNSED